MIPLQPERAESQWPGTASVAQPQATDSKKKKKKRKLRKQEHEQLAVDDSQTHSAKKSRKEHAPVTQPTLSVHSPTPQGQGSSKEDPVNSCNLNALLEDDHATEHVGIGGTSQPENGKKSAAHDKPSGKKAAAGKHGKSKRKCEAVGSRMSLLSDDEQDSSMEGSLEEAREASAHNTQAAVPLEGKKAEEQRKQLHSSLAAGSSQGAICEPSDKVAGARKSLKGQQRASKDRDHASEKAVRVEALSRKLEGSGSGASDTPDKEGHKETKAEQKVRRQRLQRVAGRVQQREGDGGAVVDVPRQQAAGESAPGAEDVNKGRAETAEERKSKRSGASVASVAVAQASTQGDVAVDGAARSRAKDGVRERPAKYSGERKQLRKRDTNSKQNDPKAQLQAEVAEGSAGVTGQPEVAAAITEQHGSGHDQVQIAATDGEGIGEAQRVQVNKEHVDNGQLSGSKSAVGVQAAADSREGFTSAWDALVVGAELAEKDGEQQMHAARAAEEAEREVQRLEVVYCSPEKVLQAGQGQSSPAKKTRLTERQTESLSEEKAASSPAVPARASALAAASSGARQAAAAAAAAVAQTVVAEAVQGKDGKGEEVRENGKHSSIARSSQLEKIKATKSARKHSVLSEQAGGGARTVTAVRPVISNRTTAGLFLQTKPTGGAAPGDMWSQLLAQGDRISAEKGNTVSPRQTTNLNVTLATRIRVKKMGASGSGTQEARTTPPALGSEMKVPEAWKLMASRRVPGQRRGSVGKQLPDCYSAGAVHASVKAIEGSASEGEEGEISGEQTQDEEMSLSVGGLPPQHVSADNSQPMDSAEAMPAAHTRHGSKAANGGAAGATPPNIIDSTNDGAGSCFSDDAENRQQAQCTVALQQHTGERDAHQLGVQMVIDTLPERQAVAIATKTLKCKELSHLPQDEPHALAKAELHQFLNKHPQEVLFKGQWPPNEATQSPALRSALRKSRRLHGVEKSNNPAGSSRKTAPRGGDGVAQAAPFIARNESRKHGIWAVDKVPGDEGTTSAASRHKKAPDHKLTNQHVELTPGQRKSQQSNRQPPSATFKPRQPTPATPPSRSSDATECNQAADQAEADRACDTQEAEEDVSLLNVESPCRALASQPAVVCGSTMPEELSMQHLQEHETEDDMQHQSKLAATELPSCYRAKRHVANTLLEAVEPPQVQHEPSPAALFSHWRPGAIRTSGMQQRKSVSAVATRAHIDGTDWEVPDLASAPQHSEEDAETPRLGRQQAAVAPDTTDVAPDTTTAAPDTAAEDVHDEETEDETSPESQSVREHGNVPATNTTTDFETAAPVANQRIGRATVQVGSRDVGEGCAPQQGSTPKARGSRRIPSVRTPPTTIRNAAVRSTIEPAVSEVGGVTPSKRRLAAVRKCSPSGPDNRLWFAKQLRSAIIGGESGEDCVEVSWGDVTAVQLRARLACASEPTAACMQGIAGEEEECVPQDNMHGVYAYASEAGDRPTRAQKRRRSTDNRKRLPQSRSDLEQPAATPRKRAKQGSHVAEADSGSAAAMHALPGPHHCVVGSPAVREQLQAPPHNGADAAAASPAPASAREPQHSIPWSSAAGSPHAVNDVGSMHEDEASDGVDVVVHHDAHSPHLQQAYASNGGSGGKEGGCPAGNGSDGEAEAPRTCATDATRAPGATHVADAMPATKHARAVPASHAHLSSINAAGCSGVTNHRGMSDVLAAAAAVTPPPASTASDRQPPAATEPLSGVTVPLTACVQAANTRQCQRLFSAHTHTDSLVHAARGGGAEAHDTDADAPDAPEGLSHTEAVFAASSSAPEEPSSVATASAGYHGPNTVLAAAVASGAATCSTLVTTTMQPTRTSVDAAVQTTGTPHECASASPGAAAGATIPLGVNSRSAARNLFAEGNVATQTHATHASVAQTDAQPVGLPPTAAAGAQQAVHDLRHFIMAVLYVLKDHSTPHAAPASVISQRSSGSAVAGCSTTPVMPPSAVVSTRAAHHMAHHLREATHVMQACATPETPPQAPDNAHNAVLDATATHTVLTVVLRDCPQVSAVPLVRLMRVLRHVVASDVHHSGSAAQVLRSCMQSMHGDRSCVERSAVAAHSPLLQPQESAMQEDGQRQQAASEPTSVSSAGKERASQGILVPDSSKEQGHIASAPAHARPLQMLLEGLVELLESGSACGVLREWCKQVEAAVVEAARLEGPLDARDRALKHLLSTQLLRCNSPRTELPHHARVAVGVLDSLASVLEASPIEHLENAYDALWGSVAGAQS